MTRYERRKFKANLYKHGNTVMYVAIFVIAGIITIAAAVNRTDKIVYIDETQVVSTEKEAVDIKDSSTQKVASTDMTTEAEIETTAGTTTEAEITTAAPVVTEPETTGQISATKVRVTTETLFVRAEASTDAEVIGMLEIDSTYDVVSQSEEWVEINYNGSKGFISAEFTEIIE